MIVSKEIFYAILGIFGIGVMGIIQSLKKLLKLDGWKALILAGIISFGATAIVLSQMSMLGLLNFLVYGALVFGEASGLYKVFTE